MHEAAGEEAVAQGLDAHLVEGEEGHEPGGLQDEDGGDADGAADAEHFQAGQDLQSNNFFLSAKM